MNDSQFSTWWEVARKGDEFRGVSMPAAYAAWLAGVASVNGKKDEPAVIPTTPQTSVVINSTDPSLDSKPTRRAGKYRAEGA